MIIGKNSYFHPLELTRVFLVVVGIGGIGPDIAVRINWKLAEVHREPLRTSDTLYCRSADPTNQASPAEPPVPRQGKTN